MSKEIDWNKRLWKVNDCVQDKIFLKRLSKWMFDISGNVNVTMRLNAIAAHTRTIAGILYKTGENPKE